MFFGRWVPALKSTIFGVLPAKLVVVFNKITFEQNRARDFLKNCLFLFSEGFSLLIIDFKGDRNIIFEISQKGKAWSRIIDTFFASLYHNILKSKATGKCYYLLEVKLNIGCKNSEFYPSSLKFSNYSASINLQLWIVLFT